MVHVILEVAGARYVLHQAHAVPSEGGYPSQHGRRLRLVVDGVEGGYEVVFVLLAEVRDIPDLEADVPGAARSSASTRAREMASSEKS